MKKHVLFLAGSALLLASCGSNNNNQQQTQAQIDSTVQATMAQHDAANAAKNDSTLKAMEAERAASMREHEHGEKRHEGEENNNNAASPAPVAPTTAPASTTTPQDDKFNKRNGTSTGQTQGTSNQAQDDKFNRRAGT